MSPNLKRSPSLTLVRTLRPVLELRRVFSAPGVLELESRELRDDLTPFSGEWFRVGDALLLELSRTEGGNATIELLKELPHKF